MKNQDTLLQSFYKSLIKPVKHTVNMYDLLLFTALLKHWNVIVQNISENKTDPDNTIDIHKVEHAVLYIKVIDPQRLFMLSLKTHTIMNFCNALLQTVDWLELGKSIGLEYFDIPDEEFSIKKISLNTKH